MPLTISDLDSRHGTDERDNYEIKQEIIDTAELVRHLLAVANSSLGGVIVIGEGIDRATKKIDKNLRRPIDWSKPQRGLKEGKDVKYSNFGSFDAWRNHFQNIIRRDFRSALIHKAFQVYTVSVDQGDLVVIEVTASPFRPFQHQDGMFWIRAGDNSIPMDRYYLEAELRDAEQRKLNTRPHTANEEAPMYYNEKRPIYISGGMPVYPSQNRPLVFVKSIPDDPTVEDFGSIQGRPENLPLLDNKGFNSYTNRDGIGFAKVEEEGSVSGATQLMHDGMIWAFDNSDRFFEVLSQQYYDLYRVSPENSQYGHMSGDFRWLNDGLFVDRLSNVLPLYKRTLDSLAIRNVTLVIGITGLHGCRLRRDACGWHGGITVRQKGSGVSDSRLVGYCIEDQIVYKKLLPVSDIGEDIAEEFKKLILQEFGL